MSTTIIVLITGILLDIAILALVTFIAIKLWKTRKK